MLVWLGLWTGFTVQWQVCMSRCVLWNAMSEVIDSFWSEPHRQKKGENNRILSLQCVFSIWIEHIMQKAHWCLQLHRLQWLQRCFIYRDVSDGCCCGPEPWCPDFCDIFALGKTTRGTVQLKKKNKQKKRWNIPFFLPGFVRKTAVQRSLPSEP